MSEDAAALNDWTEAGLLVFFIIVSSFMFVRSFGFGETAGRFPRLTAGVVLVGSALVLIQQYLPEPLRSLVAESEALFSRSEDVETAGEVGRGDENEPDEEPAGGAAARPVSDSVFTATSILAYVVASYLVGMLWTSPAFAFAYSRWFRHSWITTLALTGAAFAIAYGFMELLNLAIADGALLSLGG